MNNIQFNNTVKSTALSSTVIDDIIKKVTSITNFNDLKNDLELVVYICNCVEQEISKDDKIDKKALVIAILVRLFNISDEEKITIGLQIEFILNNKMVKKITTSSKVFNYLCSWIIKRLS